MKYLLTSLMLSVLLLQASCGPTVNTYKHTYTPAGTNSKIPAWVQQLDPSTKLVHYAEHNNNAVISNFLRTNSTKLKPVYISLALDKAMARDDLQIIQTILNSTGKDKHLFATATLGKVRSKKMLDYLVSQGGVVNGIDVGDIEAGNTIAMMAKNGPLMNMGSTYYPESARLLIEAGADPYRELAPGHTVLKGIEQLADAFAKHANLAKQTNNLNQIVRYIKTNEKLTDIERLVINGDIQKLKKQLNKSNIGFKNKRGMSLLHHAARSRQLEAVKLLVSKKPSLLKAKNKAGRTALDLVKVSKDNVAKFLSCRQNKYCKSVTSFERTINADCSDKSSVQKCTSAINKDIHGVFTSKAIASRVVELEYNNACKQFKFSRCQSFANRYSDEPYNGMANKKLETFKKNQAEKLFSSACGAKGSVKKCKAVMKKYPGIVDDARYQNAIAFLSQKCRSKETGWIYKGSKCNGNWAHGQGESINTEKKLSFKGLFKSGLRVKGIVSYNDQPMYDGVLKNGKPNGIGVCFYEGEPEKCEYYSGKRIDAIYKQRIANNKQKEEMDKRLAEMKRLQEKQSQQINQIRSQVNNTQRAQTSQSSGGSSIGQQIGDYAIQKAGEKVMDKLFDSLF